MHSAVTAHDTDSDGETDSEEGEAEPAHQQAPPTDAVQPNGIAHQYTNGHAQPQTQLRHFASSESEEEDDDGEEKEDGTQAMQVWRKSNCILNTSVIHCVCRGSCLVQVCARVSAAALQSTSDMPVHYV